MAIGPSLGFSYWKQQSIQTIINLKSKSYWKENKEIKKMKRKTIELFSLQQSPKREPIWENRLISVRT